MKALASTLAFLLCAEVIEGFRAAVADSLRELGQRMEQALRTLEQQVRRARLAMPAPQPPVLPATPDQPRLRRQCSLPGASGCKMVRWRPARR